MSNNEIVEEARSWLGTKFKHQGRVKKTDIDLGGCDCLGLIVGVAKNLKLKSLSNQPLELFDQNSYAKLLTSNMLLKQLDQLLLKVEVEHIMPGDVILLKVNNWPQHLAIISAIEPITIIHSYIQARKIVQQHLPKAWFENIVAVYRFR